jgi:hypothetical protein
MCLELECGNFRHTETRELRTPTGSDSFFAVKSRHIYTVYVSLLYSICMMKGMVIYSQWNVSPAVTCLPHLLVI